MNSRASDSEHKPIAPEPKSPNPTQPHKPGQNVIFSRSMLKGNPFYSTLVLTSLILTGMCLVLFAWDFYERNSKDPAVYYAITPEKEIRLRALSSPNLTTEALLQWASEAATTVYTLNFNNYQEVIKKARIYFTPAGYENFKDAINAAGFLGTIVQKRLVVSAVVTDTPVVLKEALLETGYYAWQVQFPMLLTYQSAGEQIRSNIVLTLLITRVAPSESVTGIGIASFVVTEASRSS